MKITFLGQGFESVSVNAVGNYLTQCLTSKDFYSFTAMSAFVSESAIFSLSSFLEASKRTFTHLNIIVGIDLRGTSKEALEEIMRININSYIFYQAEQPIFHPKIYLFEGVNNTKLIVGSSNLTRGGLFTNIESSLLIEFDSDDKEGSALVAELKLYYRSLFDFSDPNLLIITQDLINDLFAKGLIPDEASRIRSFKNASPVLPSNGNQAISSIFTVPNRPVAKVPAFFVKKQKKVGINAGVQPPVAVAASPAILPKMLVWRKDSLSNSDAQHVPAGTAITGNLKLSQAKFSRNNILIDQKSYFRNTVFNTLNWVKTKPNSNSYEEVIVPFEVTIFGASIGTFSLKLSHDLVRVAGQGNTPTWLHWGNSIIPHLQRRNIAGRSLNLYKSGSSFSIEIV